MKRNNRGFTLTETIVAVAILAIVILGVYAFMVAGSKTYRSVSATVKLQTAAQQTMSQLQETMLDCNRGVCTQDGESLYLLSRSASGAYTIRAYTLDAETNTLYYQEINGVNNALTVQAVYDAQKHLLSENVAAFSAVQKLSVTQTTAITLQLEFIRDGKRYPATQTVALRNTPTSCADLETLIDLAQ